MKIAFISYEFPPDTGFGGIGTYTYQLSIALAGRGHTVEVFSCSREEDKLNIVVEALVTVHRVKADKRSIFAERIVAVFAQRHAITGFDLIESPEYCAEGLQVRKAFPAIPMVVKLHTPLYLVNRLNNVHKPVSFKKKVKQLIGRSSYNKNGDADYQLAAAADAVCAPSRSLADIISKEWGIKHIDVVPNYYKPLPGFYNITAADARNNIVAFTGRLEVRKGILSLLRAIPLVLKAKPGIVFRFIGSSGDAPGGNGSMEAYIRQQLPGFLSQLHFTGFVHREDMPEAVKDVTLFVFPSVWENFPYVCLEAMSAAKAVVASDAGGMKEMLEGENGGKIVDAKDHKALAHAIIGLLNNAGERARMAQHNRKRVQDYYASAVLNTVEDYYQKVVSLQQTIKH